MFMKQVSVSDTLTTLRVIIISATLLFAVDPQQAGSRRLIVVTCGVVRSTPPAPPCAPSHPSVP